MAFGGVGNAALLDGPLTAFFASRTCPDSAIRLGVDWAVAEARAGHTVISGFHSPLERSVLEVLLTARSKVVICVGARCRKSAVTECLARGGSLSLFYQAQAERPDGPAHRTPCERMIVTGTGQDGYRP